MKAKLGDSIIFVAPTDKTADNLPFACETIHHAFLISPMMNLSNIEVSNRKLNILREKFVDKRYLVIEEYSMIGCRLFYSIDFILKKVFNSEDNFGGLSILLCGDIGQLLLVNDIPIWSRVEESDPEVVARSKFLFSSFQTNYTLTEVMRHKGIHRMNLKVFWDESEEQYLVNQISNTLRLDLV